MKVLHVLDHSLPEVDGYSIRSQNILLQQKHAGQHVVALTSPKHGRARVPSEEIDGIRFYRTCHEEAKRGIRSLPYFKETLLIIHLYRRIVEIAREEQIQIVHAHSPSLNGLAAYLAARRLNLALFYELRTLWEEAPSYGDRSLLGWLRFKISRWVESQLMKRVQAITVISQGLRQELVNRGICDDKIVVVPNGVDLERFSPRATDETLKRQLGLHERFIVGFIGSFFFWEGLDLLISAASKVVQVRPDIHLLFVGQDENDGLHHIVKSLELVKFVTFTGQVPPDRILDYYSIVDLFVYPRISMPLTELVTPLKPLEAMAMEKLVLASDVGGHKELIRNKETGLLFKAGNVTDLAQKIIDIATSREQQLAIREQGRRHVVRNRNWKLIASGYSDLYRRVVTSS